MVEQVVKCSQYLNKHLTLALLNFLDKEGIANTKEQ
jgi:hypothetical protein